jgi:hypothetical protein
MKQDSIKGVKASEKKSLSGTEEGIIAKRNGLNSDQGRRRRHRQKKEREQKTQHRFIWYRRVMKRGGVGGLGCVYSET